MITLNDFIIAVNKQDIKLFDYGALDLKEQALDLIAEFCQFDRNSIDQFKDHIVLEYAYTAKDDVNDLFKVYTIRAKRR